MRMKGEGKLHTISAKSCVLAGTGGANVGACVSCRTFSCATTSLGSSSMSSPEKPKLKDMFVIRGFGKWAAIGWLR
jgi:hypothetical protein